MCNMFGVGWSTRREILLVIKLKEEWVMAMDVDPTTAGSKRNSKSCSVTKRSAVAGNAASDSALSGEVEATLTDTQ